MSSSAKYEAVIGLEIHVQLATQSKMFCRCDNQSDGVRPNTNVCPVCLGMPGTLPVPNRQAVRWALKAAMALGCEIPTESKFDRKQYFYPDLPKGYQISQYDQPFGGPGKFEFDLVGTDGSVEAKTVGITRLHLEEDAGKLTHPPGAGHSLVDLNRAGTPLAEIVTEPDLRSPAEAKAFMQELRLLMRTIGVSDADMEKGHLRADANISVRPVGQQKFGVKTELKNLNSFRFVEKGLEVEFARQVELLEKGEAVVQETRGFDEKKSRTVSQRGKEEAHDYRYFPEPDIPPLKPHELGLDELRAELPELPVTRRRTWRERGVGAEAVAVIGQDPRESEAFSGVLTAAPERPADAGRLWMMLRSDQQLAADGFTGLAQLVSALLVSKATLTGPQTKQLAAAFAAGKGSVEELLADPAFAAMESTDLEAAVDHAIKENPKPVEDFKKGNVNAAQAIVGAVMKATKGSADPTAVAALVQKKLSQN